MHSSNVLSLCNCCIFSLVICSSLFCTFTHELCYTFIPFFSFNYFPWQYWDTTVHNLSLTFRDMQYMFFKSWPKIFFIFIQIICPYFVFLKWLPFFIFFFLGNTQTLYTFNVSNSKMITAEATKAIYREFVFLFDNSRNNIYISWERIRTDKKFWKMG